MAKLAQELDPTIWSNLPRDVVLNIVEQSDLPTQVNWSCTSRAIYPFASCNIWSSLQVRSSEITAYFFIVHGYRPTDRADGMMHFLLESAYRRDDSNWTHVYASDRTCGTFIHRPNGVERYFQPQQRTATLPISHVKTLAIDNQGFDIRQPICEQLDMDVFLPRLLVRLPQLKSFSYVGPLSPKCLAAIIQVDSLRVLQVRNGDDVLPGIATPTHIMPWMDYSVDWSSITNLKGLQALEVGRLMPCESRVLAKGVASLNLRKLHISCWGWDYANTGPSIHIHPRWAAHKSALIVFLDDLRTLNLGGGQTCRGLPSTLKRLVLVDKFQTWIPSLYQLVAKAIVPCENLETLSTTIIVNGDCYDSITKMGLPAYHKIVGLGSWQQLASDEGMKVLHQYQSSSGETLLTNPYPKPLRNIAKSLDQVISTADGIGRYRMSMNFVKKRQVASGEIIVYPGEGECRPFGIERGPQAQDSNMQYLAEQFEQLSHDDTM